MEARLKIISFLVGYLAVFSSYLFNILTFLTLEELPFHFRRMKQQQLLKDVLEELALKDFWNMKWKLSLLEFFSYFHSWSIDWFQYDGNSEFNLANVYWHHVPGRRRIILILIHCCWNTEQVMACNAMRILILDELTLQHLVSKVIDT